MSVLLDGSPRHGGNLNGCNGSFEPEPTGALFLERLSLSPVLSPLDPRRRQVENAAYHVEGGADDVQVGPECEWVPLGRAAGRRGGLDLLG